MKVETVENNELTNIQDRDTGSVGLHNNYSNKFFNLCETLTRNIHVTNRNFIMEIISMQLLLLRAEPSL